MNAPAVERRRHPRLSGKHAARRQARLRTGDVLSVLNIGIHLTMPAATEGAVASE